MKRPSYTLAELTVAVGLLSMVILGALNTFSNVVKSREHLVRENLLYSESRVVMEIMAEAISQNVIDYSEYYNRLVIEGNFGENSHYYATRFVDPAESCTDLGTGLNTINALTSAESGFSTDLSDLGGCCYRLDLGGYYKISSSECNDDSEPTSVGEDFWSGQNPYSSDLREGIENTNASAFCDNDLAGGSQLKCSDVSNQHEVDQLYLLSPDGHTKTIFVKEIINGEDLNLDANIGALSYIKMDGTDSQNDSDAYLDTWDCNTFFQCTEGSQNQLPSNNDFDSSHNELALDDYFINFVPLSSFDINIIDLKFYISPLEDPLLAYSEDSANQYPSVTIVMTTELGNNSQVGSNINLKLQTTVTPRYREIKTYSLE